MSQLFPDIPDFTILEQAGKGGMGTVFVAEQHSPRRKVALKVLTRAPSAETLAEFRREAKVIAGLEHPRIVPLYGYGEVRGLPYLVMRYLRGGSLADRIPMDLGRAIKWLTEIAEALDIAHERGLIHRDVKPSNILLDEQGSAYLSDFGIAGTLADVRSAQPTGSVAYMSPEQGRGEGIDQRSDTYSLAVTLFEVLTGQQPYLADTPLAVIARHMHYPVPSAKELDPSIPTGVDKVLQRGMAKDPGDRPATSGEFAQLVLHAPTAEPEPSPEDLTQRRRRTGWIIGAAAIGLLAVIVIGGGALLGFSSQDEDLPRPTATLPGADEASASVQAQPTASLDSSLLLDDFSAPDSGFGVLNDADGGVAYVDGALEFTAFTEGVRWFSPSGRVEHQDVMIEALAQVLSGSGLAEVALLCRFQDLDNYTALAVRGDGAAAIWQLREGETQFLQEWEPRFSGFPGELIPMRGSCRGAELQLEVADRVVAEAADPFPISGDIALMAGMGAQAELKVRFDDLRVSR